MHACIDVHAYEHARVCASECVHVCEWGEGLGGGELADAPNGALIQRELSPSPTHLRYGPFGPLPMLEPPLGGREGSAWTESQRPSPSDPRPGLTKGLGQQAPTWGEKTEGMVGPWRTGARLPAPWRGTARGPQHAVLKSPQTSPQDLRGR